MKIFYCDASFDWNQTETNGEDVVRGKIAISNGNSFGRIEKVVIGKVENLKQYINIYELTAIARAIELASEENPKSETLTIFTDSMTAMYWSRNNKIPPKIATTAHDNALEYLRRARIQFGGEVIFNHVLREQNPAGFLLEKELEKESPNTI